MGKKSKKVPTPSSSDSESEQSVHSDKPEQTATPMGEELAEETKPKKEVKRDFFSSWVNLSEALVRLRVAFDTDAKPNVKFYKKGDQARAKISFGKSMDANLRCCKDTKGNYYCSKMSLAYMLKSVQNRDKNLVDMCDEFDASCFDEPTATDSE